MNMTIEAFIYKWEYDGKELLISAKNKLSKQTQINEAKKLVLKDYPSFDEKKLKFIYGNKACCNV